MVRLITAVLAALSVSVVLADDNPPTCNPSQKCPADKPCCSQYGQCGTGAYCLGGCDPISSNSLQSCAPEPICQSKSFATWDNLDDVAPNTKYLGDATQSDWVSSGQPLPYKGDLLLTMAPNTSGTLLAYNHYLWYGKVTANLKTSRSAGVVTAFILLSDVKDEIDWEFIGTELTTGQTNFYWQGVLDYHNSVNATTTDTFENFHTYEIDWNPDQTTWSIDGKVVRTLKKADTYNSTTRNFQYPQTPSRLQLSLWPGGAPSNAPGTVQWAGGPISWDTPDIQNHGYYYATFQEVTIECYNPPAGANVQGSQSYIYTDPAGTNNTVEITNDNTVLGSFEATGTNMTAGAQSATSSGATTAPAPSVSDSVPGMNGGGSGSQASAQAANPNGGSSPSGTTAGPGSSQTGFSQGGGSNPEPNLAPSTNERMLEGSVFAVLVAVVALIAM